MFGLGFSELLVIMFVILILFGPDKLPELAKRLGKFMGDLDRSTRGMRREFYNSVYTPAQEVKRTVERELKGVKDEMREIEKGVKEESNK